MWFSNQLHFSVSVSFTFAKGNSHVRMMQLWFLEPEGSIADRRKLPKTLVYPPENILQEEFWMAYMRGF